jgi:hypothetical protein
MNPAGIRAASPAGGATVGANPHRRPRTSGNRPHFSAIRLLEIRACSRSATISDELAETGPYRDNQSVRQSVYGRVLAFFSRT